MVTNPNAENVLPDVVTEYGKNYFLLFIFLTGTFVEEKMEAYIFDIDTAIFAIGGTMGLFLGWSLYSIIMELLTRVESVLRCLKGQR